VIRFSFLRLWLFIELQGILHIFDKEERERTRGTTDLLLSKTSNGAARLFTKLLSSETSLQLSESVQGEPRARLPRWLAQAGADLFRVCGRLDEI
jgi:hypothetical protein